MGGWEWETHRFPIKVVLVVGLPATFGERGALSDCLMFAWMQAGHQDAAVGAAVGAALLLR